MSTTNESNIVLKLRDEASKGLKDVTKESDKLGTSLRDVSKVDLSKVGVGLTAGITLPAIAAGAAALKLVRDLGDTSAELTRMSQVTGLSVRTLQELKVVAESTHVEFGAVEGVVNLFSNQLYGGAGASDTLLASLKQLGVEIKDGNGRFRSMGELFPEVLEKLRGIADESDRNAAAFAIFGRSAKDVIPILSMTSAEYSTLVGQAERAGNILGDDQVRAAAAFEGSLANLRRELSGMVQQLAVMALPILQEFVSWIRGNVVPALQGFIEWIRRVKDWFDGLSPSIQAAITTFGTLMVVLPPVITLLGGLSGAITAIKIALGATNPVILAVIAALTALSVIVSTVIGWLKGRDGLKNAFNEVSKAAAAQDKDSLVSGLEKLSGHLDGEAKDAIDRYIENIKSAKDETLDWATVLGNVQEIARLGAENASLQAQSVKRNPMVGIWEQERQDRAANVAYFYDIERQGYKLSAADDAQRTRDLARIRELDSMLALERSYNDDFQRQIDANNAEIERLSQAPVTRKPYSPTTTPGWTPPVVPDKDKEPPTRSELTQRHFDVLAADVQAGTKTVTDALTESNFQVGKLTKEFEEAVGQGDYDLAFELQKSLAIATGAQETFTKEIEKTKGKLSQLSPSGGMGEIVGDIARQRLAAMQDPLYSEEEKLDALISIEEDGIRRLQAAGYNYEAETQRLAGYREKRNKLDVTELKNNLEAQLAEYERFSQDEESWYRDRESAYRNAAISLSRIDANNPLIEEWLNQAADASSHLERLDLDGKIQEVKDNLTAALRDAYTLSGNELYQAVADANNKAADALARYLGDDSSLVIKLRQDAAYNLEQIVKAENDTVKKALEENEFLYREGLVSYADYLKKKREILYNETMRLADERGYNDAVVLRLMDGVRGLDRLIAASTNTTVGTFGQTFRQLTTTVSDGLKALDRQIRDGEISAEDAATRRRQLYLDASYAFEDIGNMATADYYRGLADAIDVADAAMQDLLASDAHQQELNQRRLQASGDSKQYYQDEISRLNALREALLEAGVAPDSKAYFVINGQLQQYVELLREATTGSAAFREELQKSVSSEPLEQAVIDAQYQLAELGQKRQELINEFNRLATSGEDTSEVATEIGSVERAIVIQGIAVDNATYAWEQYKASQKNYDPNVANIRSTITYLELLRGLYEDDAEAIAILDERIQQLQVQLAGIAHKQAVAGWEDTFKMSLAYTRQLAGVLKGDVAETVGQTLDMLEGVGSGVFSLLKGDLGGIIQIGVSVINWLISVFTPAWKKVAAELKKSLASSIAGAVSSALSNAIQKGETENLNKEVRSGIFQAVLSALIDAFVQASLIKGILQPLIDELSTAIAKGNFDAAIETFRLAMSATDKWLKDNKDFVNKMTSESRKYLKDGIEDVEETLSWGQFISQSISIPFYDATVRFDGSVTAFGTSIDRLVDEGISISANVSTTQASGMLPAAY